MSTEGFVLFVGDEVVSDVVHQDSFPTPFDVGPPNTIAGLPVTTFSYILLAVGGIAPVIFIIVVMVSMKCYMWRKVRRYQEYANQMVRQGLWIFEQDVENSNSYPHSGASSYHSLHGLAGTSMAEGINLGFLSPTHLQVPPDPHAIGLTPGSGTYLAASTINGPYEELSGTASHNGYSDKDMQLSIASLKASISNPNVFFRETPLVTVDLAEGIQKASTWSNNLSRGNGSQIGPRNTPLKAFVPPIMNQAHSDSVEPASSSNEHDASIGNSAPLSPHVESADTDCSMSIAPPPSLSSEERRALACFDNIYDGVTVTGQASPSNGLQAGAPKHKLLKPSGNSTEGEVPSSSSTAQSLVRQVAIEDDDSSTEVNDSSVVVVEVHFGTESRDPGDQATGANASDSKTIMKISHPSENFEVAEISQFSPENSLGDSNPDRAILNMAEHSMTTLDTPPPQSTSTQDAFTSTSSFTGAIMQPRHMSNHSNGVTGSAPWRHTNGDISASSGSENYASALAISAAKRRDLNYQDTQSLPNEIVRHLGSNIVSDVHDSHTSTHDHASVKCETDLGSALHKESYVNSAYMPDHTWNDSIRYISIRYIQYCI